MEMDFLWIGLLVGTIGTLIGAGGGFILIPILIYYFPSYGPSKIAALSMLAVCSNAASGSFAYTLKRQIHWKSAFVFSIAAFPGVILGTALNGLIDKKKFVLIFGFLLIVLSIYIFIKSNQKEFQIKENEKLFIFDVKKAYWGAGVSILVGIISSFLGIGGGIIHVPLLGTVLGYPIHLATGTSHFILGITSAVAVMDHWGRGNYGEVHQDIFWLIGAIIVGAQIGAMVSKHVDSNKILKILSLALVIGGIRLCLY